MYETETLEPETVPVEMVCEGEKLLDRYLAR
jgi:hypothetical protein